VAVALQIGPIALRNDRGSPPPFVDAYRARVGHESKD
jgi:hypothetical protein